MSVYGCACMCACANRNTNLYVSACGCVHVSAVLTIFKDGCEQWARSDTWPSDSNESSSQAHRLLNRCVQQMHTTMGIRFDLVHVADADVEAAGAGRANVQRELTSYREIARYRRLDVSIRALPADDVRRTAWVNMDRFSTTWVSTLPTSDCRVTNAEFVEIAARYFGLPSPACAALVGKPIGSTRATLDPHGSRLAAASLPGDGFRRQHDTIKWRLDEDLHEMVARVRTASANRNLSLANQKESRPCA